MERVKKISLAMFLAFFLLLFPFLLFSFYGKSELLTPYRDLFVAIAPKVVESLSRKETRRFAEMRPNYRSDFSLSEKKKL